MVDEGRRVMSARHLDICTKGLSSEQILTLSQTNPGFYVSAVQVFLKTLGKEEIARNEQFLLFPQCFQLVLENFLLFSSNSKLSSANSFNLEECKICRLGKG